MDYDKLGRKPLSHSQIPDVKRSKSNSIENSKFIIRILYFICFMLLICDPFIHKHGPFDVEYVWGFYTFCGFIACVTFVVGAKLLRVILMQPEGYYD
ncbi:MAG: hypothetical protein TECD_00644 [Hyphomicrobiaceae bacterium hypho_1]